MNVKPDQKNIMIIEDDNIIARDPIGIGVKRKTIDNIDNSNNINNSKKIKLDHTGINPEEVQKIKNIKRSIDILNEGCEHNAIVNHENAPEVFKSNKDIAIKALCIKKHYQNDYYVFTHGQSIELSVINEYIHLLMKKFYQNFYHPLNVPFRIPDTSTTKTRAELFSKFTIDAANGSTFEDNNNNFETISVDTYILNSQINESAAHFIDGSWNINLRYDSEIAYKIIRDLLFNFLPHEYFCHCLAKKIEKVGLNKKQITNIGTLYVICVLKKEIDQMGYRSHPYGKYCDIKKCYPKQTNEEILEQLQNNIPLYCNVNDRSGTDVQTIPQYRLLPALMAEKPGVRSIALNKLSQVDQRKFKTQLKNIFKEMMFYIKLLDLNGEPTDAEINVMCAELKGMLDANLMTSECIGYLLSNRISNIPQRLKELLKGKADLKEVASALLDWQFAFNATIYKRNWTYNRKVFNYAGSTIHTGISIYDRPGSNKSIHFNMPHGKGSLVQKPEELNPLRYEGDFSYGCLNGSGKLYYDRFNFISGIWKNNILANGKKEWIEERKYFLYDGDFINVSPIVFEKIMPHGMGKLKWSESVVSKLNWSDSVYRFQYSGEFYLGKFHGKGTLNRINTDSKFQIEGVWEHGLIKRGSEVLIHPGKPPTNIFEGEFHPADGSGPVMYKEGKLFSETGKLIYEGFFLNNKPHDENGIMTYKPGSTFTGQFVNGIREGRGTRSFQDGTYYVGDYIKDRSEGGTWYFKDSTFIGKIQKIEATATTREYILPLEGKMTYGPKSTFEGTFLNGLKHKGIRKFPDGAIYGVDFMNGEPLEDAFWYLKEGVSYKGKIIVNGPLGHENIIVGEQGLMFYQDNTTYEGNFIEGKAYGMGKRIYSNGDVLEGYFEGVPLKGVLKSSEGTYTGGVQELVVNAKTIALKHGKGYLKQPNGITYHGEFKEGLLHGKAIVKYPNGLTYKGEYVSNEQKEGLWKWADGKTFKGPVKLIANQNNEFECLPHGLGIMKINGEVYKGEFVNGEYKDNAPDS